MTAKEYLRFDRIEKETKPKTNVYAVHDKRSNDYLGDIRWLAPWRQYIFDVQGILLSRGCMRQVCRFIDNLMIEQRKGLHGLDAKRNE